MGEGPSFALEETGSMKDGKRRPSGTVEELDSGRFRARKKDPVTNRYVSYGTHDTEEEAWIALERPVPSKGGITLSEFGVEFLKRRRAKVLDWSNDESRWKLYVDGAELGAIALDDLRRRHLLDWLAWLAQNGLEHQTRKNALSLVRVALGEALDYEFVQENVARDVKVGRRRDALEKEPWTIFYPEEQLAILKVVPADEWHTVAFALGCGPRNSEQWRCKVEDVSLQRREVTLRKTKNGRIRTVPLFGLALEAAKEALFRQKKGCEFAFPSPRTNEQRWHDSHPSGWAKWLREAGIKRSARWYDLRHTCATSLLAGWWGRKWSLDEVSQMLGHSSTKVTERYAHFLAETLKRAAEGTGFHGSTAVPRNYGADFGIRTRDLRFTNPRNIQGFSGLAVEEFRKRSTASADEQAANILEATRLAYRMGGDRLAKARVEEILETEARRVMGERGELEEGHV